MSKRPREDGLFDVPINETGKAIFVRNQDGDLVTVLPGAPMPAKALAASDAAKDVVEKANDVHEELRLKERTPEEMQYEAYLASKQNKGGNVWIPNAGQGASDRAAFTDSLAAELAEQRAAESSGKQYAPSKAYDRARAVKHQKGQASGGTLGGTSAEAAKAGAAAANEAMARALEASDDEDDGSMSMNAVQLANRAMDTYNLPVSNIKQADVHGNDLNAPKLQRKLRKFLECFAEDVAVRTTTGAAVLKDFEALKKRYTTVFRESGSELRGEVRRRWYFERPPAGGGGEDDDDDGDDGDDGGDTFVIDFERHTSLVTPRPGMPLDGSMGVMPPRTQDLVVLYQASGSEIAGMWIAPDTANLGGDAAATREAIEASEVFRALRSVLDGASGGGELQAHYNNYLE